MPTRSMRSTPSPPASPPAGKRQRVGTRTASEKNTDVLPFDQRFPFEVIEPIYLLSENISLSLCNKRLYGMLTRRQTRVEMAFRAFSPAWDTDWTLPENEDYSHHSPRPGNPAFQTALLQCRWVDMPLLLDAQQLWMRRTFLGGGQDKDAPLAIPRKQHIALRRPKDPTASLARELRIDPEQALAIEKAHATLGCAEITHNWTWSITPPWPAMLAHVPQHLESEDDGSEDASGDESRQGGVDDDGIRLPPSPPTPPFFPVHLDWPTSPATPGLWSMRACFEYEMLNATFNLSKWREITSNFNGDMQGYALETPFDPLTHDDKHRYVHRETVIPERLLLAEGAPADLPDNARLDAVTLERCRARLQRTYELLLWLVLGGARLQDPTPVEATAEGARRLLHLAGAEDRACKGKNWAKKMAQTSETAQTAPDTDAAAASKTSLRLSVKALAVSMLALFQDLDAFSAWPPSVVLDVLQRRRPSDSYYRNSYARQYLEIACMDRLQRRNIWNAKLENRFARDPQS